MTCHSTTGPSTAGGCTFAPADADERGVWIAETLHRHGSGPEAVAAVRALACTRLDCTVFRYPVAEQNAPSRRLAESLGGVPVLREGGVKCTAIVHRVSAAAAQVATDVAEIR
ncbi:GNAT family N-acetyltransferase [Stenotrophomonas maltophilia]